MKNYIFPAAAIIFIALSFYAPYYLTYADHPAQSSAVVLLVGHDFKARKKEAYQLIAGGYANYLIIPAHGKILKVSNNGIFSPIKQNHIVKNNSRMEKKEKNDLRFYEDTHIELLVAKKMIDRLGLRSSIFVSSPYHMRRIKLIAGRVFNKTCYKIFIVPSRYENVNKNLWWVHKDDIKWLFSEYLKIVWFLLYSPFCK